MKDIFYFIKQIHAYTGKILYFNLFAMSCVGFLEGISTLLLITMINVIGIIDFGIMNSIYLSFLSFLERIPTVYILPIVLVFYLSISILFQYLHKNIMIRNIKIQNGFLSKLRIETYQALFNTKWSFFIKHRKSDLINIIDTEVEEVGSGIDSILYLLSTLILTSMQILIALWLSPIITVFVLISGLFLVIVNRNFLKRAHALGNRNYELGKEFFAGITDQLNGIKDIKSNSLEKSRISWFRGITKQMEEEQLTYITLKKTSEFYYNSASAMFIVVFIFISFTLFQSQAGQLLMIIVIFSRLWPQVSSIHSYLEYIAAEMPSFRVVKAFQQECKEMMEFQEEDYENAEPLQMQYAMECQNVYFRYNLDEERQTLKNINIIIPANQMTAFVGKSGAGKSTIIDILMGLHIPEIGDVLVDGVPLTKENLLALRQTLSYVPQDPFLFSTSIRENLMLTKENATEEEIWAALTFASANDFVGKLPNGLDTVIGDRGIKLSGGERQRLVLARAILKKPSILILDEATSALDSESESKIQEALESLKGKMTIIVIAHRLSTIRNADQVIVVEDGQIIQQGSFVQLAQEGNQAFSNLLRKHQLKIHSIT